MLRTSQPAPPPAGPSPHADCRPAPASLYWPAQGRGPQREQVLDTRAPESASTLIVDDIPSNILVLREASAAHSVLASWAKLSARSDEALRAALDAPALAARLRELRQLLQVSAGWQALASPEFPIP